MIKIFILTSESYFETSINKYNVEVLGAYETLEGAKDRIKDMVSYVKDNISNRANCYKSKIKKSINNKYGDKTEKYFYTNQKNETFEVTFRITEKLLSK